MANCNGLNGPGHSDAMSVLTTIGWVLVYFVFAVFILGLGTMMAAIYIETFKQGDWTDFCAMTMVGLLALGAALIALGGSAAC